MQPQPTNAYGGVTHSSLNGAQFPLAAGEDTLVNITTVAVAHLPPKTDAPKIPDSKEPGSPRPPR